MMGSALERVPRILEGWGPKGTGSLGGILCRTEHLSRSSEVFANLHEPLHCMCTLLDSSIIFIH